jgi:hypothetical protein
MGCSADARLEHGEAFSAVLANVCIVQIFDLNAQRRDRSSKLMRGVGDKSTLMIVRKSEGDRRDAARQGRRALALNGASSNPIRNIACRVVCLAEAEAVPKRMDGVELRC